MDISEYIVQEEPIYLYESKQLFENDLYAFNLRKKYNVHFDIIYKEDIAKMEPSLEPIY